jgi:hypothetical protein
MNDTEVALLEQTTTALHEGGRVSETAWSYARRVVDWSRGVVPKDQWHTLQQDVAAYGRQVEAVREGQPEWSTRDTDRRVSALLFKTLNGDTYGMLRDLVGLLLEAYRDARVATAR